MGYSLSKNPVATTSLLNLDTGIIQDDKDDWERESARMADVYSQSYVALAASCAASCDQGISKLREKPLPISIGFEDDDGPFDLYFDQRARGVGVAEDFIHQVIILIRLHIHYYLLWILEGASAATCLGFPRTHSSTTDVTFRHRPTVLGVSRWSYE